MSVHVAGIIGLVVVFLIGTLRPINLGALALVMMFVHGTIYGQSVQDMYRGFSLFVLLAGITYLFGIASNNGTLARMVEGMARLAGDRRALIPWSVFIIAALPTMAGALTATSVALPGQSLYSGGSCTARAGGGCVAAVFRGVIDSVEAVRNAQRDMVMKQLDDLQKRQQKVITCVYGPINTQTNTGLHVVSGTPRPCEDHELDVCT